MPSAIAAFELAKLGADVIKVEFPPDGDYLRTNPPYIEGRGDMHLDLNRNKRSICVDPRHPAGKRVLQRLIEDTDMVIVAARPQSLKGLGLDYESCAALNPRLIHCTISGYGTSGPYSGLAAHGLSSDAAAGLVPIAEDSSGKRVGTDYLSVGPRAAGLNAALAMVASLNVADGSVRSGRSIDVSQWDSAVAWNYRDLDLYTNTGERTPQYQGLGFRYAVYSTCDDREILFAAPEPHIWRRFCQAVDRPDLASLAGDSVIEFQDNASAGRELDAIFRTRSQEAWVEMAIREGIPIAPVVPLEELPSNPHLVAREMLVEGEHPLGGMTRLTGHPAKFGDDLIDWSPAPELGQHTSAILSEAGYSAAEVKGLLGDEAVFE
jgi:crotonobetainyl-CoA:carnitine CoA-transferase CaiB-like acyl-CoA transferase